MSFLPGEGGGYQKVAPVVEGVQQLATRRVTTAHSRYPRMALSLSSIDRNAAIKNMLPEYSCTGVWESYVDLEVQLIYYIYSARSQKCKASIFPHL